MMAGYTKRDWMCLRKRRYDTIEECQSVVDRINAKRLQIGVAAAYRCPFCQKWHVGREKGKRYSK